MLSIRKLPRYTAEKFYLVAELQEAPDTDILYIDDLLLGSQKSSNGPYDLILFYFVWNIEKTDASYFSKEVYNALHLAIVKSKLSNIKFTNGNTSKNVTLDDKVSSRSGRVVVCVDCFDSRLNAGINSVEKLPCDSISRAYQQICQNFGRLIGSTDLRGESGLEGSIASDIRVLFAVGNNKKASFALETIGDLCRVGGEQSTRSYTKVVISQNSDRFIGITSTDNDASEEIEPHGASDVVQYLIVSSNSSGVALDFSPQSWLGLTSLHTGLEKEDLQPSTVKVISPYKGDENSLIGSMAAVVIAVVVPLCIWYFKWVI